MKIEASSICFDQKDGNRISAVITASRGVCRKLAADWGAVVDGRCLSEGCDDLIFAGRYDENAELWKASWCVAELIYFRLVESGVPPSEAEEVLPDSVMAMARLTLSVEEWKRFCRECSGSGPHLSRLAVLASFRLKEIFPGDFDDLKSFSGKSLTA